MREHKYRVWDNAEECYWTVGSIYFSEGKIDIYRCEVNDETGQSEQVSNYYMPLGDRFVLEQFTGLKDKNSKSVFEGDLIDAHPDGTRRYLRTVEWDDDFAQFRALFPDGSGQLFTRRQCLTYEVIGNIHSTPELLK